MKKHIPRLLPVLACLALLTAALLPPQISRLRDQALSGAVHAEGWNSSLERPLEPDRQCLRRRDFLRRGANDVILMQKCGEFDGTRR